MNCLINHRRLVQLNACQSCVSTGVFCVFSPCPRKIEFSLSLEYRHESLWHMSFFPPKAIVLMFNVKINNLLERHHLASCSPPCQNKKQNNSNLSALRRMKWHQICVSAYTCCFKTLGRFFLQCGKLFFASSSISIHHQDHRGSQKRSRAACIPKCSCITDGNCELANCDGVLAVNIRCYSCLLLCGLCSGTGAASDL